MKILAIEKDIPGATGVASRSLLKDEAARVWELYQSGVLREIYFRQGRTNAVLVLECASLEDASLILGTLPLVHERLIEFEVIPLIPYPGISRLFGDENLE